MSVIYYVVLFIYFQGVSGASGGPGRDGPPGQRVSVFCKLNSNYIVSSL